ncbi:MAG: hypothetical protein U0841_26555 [Chloroflexia bacterium]
MALAQTIGPTMAPEIWIDIGITDTWASRTTALKDELRARGTPRVQRERGRPRRPILGRTARATSASTPSAFAPIAPHLSTGTP